MSNRLDYVKKIVENVKSMPNDASDDESCDKMQSYIDRTTKNILVEFISNSNCINGDEMSAPFAFSVACLRAAYIINMITCTDKMGSKSETAKTVLNAITKMLSPEEVNISPDGEVL